MGLRHYRAGLQGKSCNTRYIGTDLGLYLYALKGACFRAVLMRLLANCGSCLLRPHTVSLMSAMSSLISARVLAVLDVGVSQRGRRQPSGRR